MLALSWWDEAPVLVLCTASSDTQQGQAIWVGQGVLGQKACQGDRNIQGMNAAESSAPSSSLPEGVQILGRPAFRYASRCSLFTS